MTEEIKKEDSPKSFSPSADSTSHRESVEKGATMSRVFSCVAFLLASISLIISFVYIKGLNRQIAAIDSEIWSVRVKVNKVGDEMRLFNSSLTGLEKKMTGFEKSLVISELKQISATVQDISKRSSARVQEHAYRIGENITALVYDLEHEGVDFLSGGLSDTHMEKPANMDKTEQVHSEHWSRFGEVHVEPEGKNHN